MSTVFFQKPDPVDLSACGLAVTTVNAEGKRQQIAILRESWDSFYSVWILPKLPNATLDDLATIERLDKAMRSEAREVELLTRDSEVMIAHKPAADQVIQRFGTGYYIATIPFHRALLTMTSEPTSKPVEKPSNGATATAEA